MAPYVPEIGTSNIRVNERFQVLPDSSKGTYLPCDSSLAKANQECSRCLLQASMESSGIPYQRTMVIADPPTCQENVNYIIPVDIDFSSLENVADEQLSHEDTVQDWHEFEWLDYI